MIMWNRRRAERPRPSDAPGFTLLEVLVAVAIVAIALVTFLGLHVHSLDDTIRAQTRVRRTGSLKGPSWHASIGPRR
jgi:prepilin-type N-terminal cleavage/methylation domain-containing protein